MADEGESGCCALVGRCAGVVDAAGVARGEMGEDLLEDLGRLDARDDVQRTVTHATVFDVDVKDAFELLHPAHGRGTSCMWLVGGLMDKVEDDAVAVFEVRGEHGEMGTGTTSVKARF